MYGAGVGAWFPNYDFILVLEDQNNSWGATYLNSSK